MPLLRPLAEPERYDARFFVDVVVPAARAAGFAGALVLAPQPGDVVVEADPAALHALLAGRAPPPQAPVVRGTAGALRALAAALAPRPAPRAHPTRDVGADPLAASTPDEGLVRRAGGGYIKARRAVRAPRGTRAMSALDAAPAAATDRTAFALANLAAFLDAALRAAAGARDDEVLVLAPARVRRG